MTEDTITREEIEEAAESLGLTPEQFIEVSKDPGARFQAGLIDLVNEAQSEGVDPLWLYELIDEITSAIISKAAEEGQLGTEFQSFSEDSEDGFIHHVNVIYSTAKADSRGVSRKEMVENMTSVAKMVANGVDMQAMIPESKWPGR